MPFIWLLGKTSTPDEMNTSYSRRIDADRWDFHDGIDSPTGVDRPVNAMATSTVHSAAGPADKTGPGHAFGSTHVVLKEVDPMDGTGFVIQSHLPEKRTPLDATRSDGGIFFRVRFFQGITSSLVDIKKRDAAK